MIFPAEYTFEELDAALTSMEESYRLLLSGSDPVRPSLLVDISAVKSSSARNRQRIAHSQKHLAAVMRSRVIAQAYVAPTALIRGALTAVFWLDSPPWPVQVFGVQAQALEWLQLRMGEQGVSMPTPSVWWKG